MNARMRRIAADYEQIKKNFDGHRNIVVEPIGEEPAERYRVTYFVNGIYLRPDGKAEVLGKHVITINLHADYPRYKPICTIETPIWHPNFRDGQICIGDIWGAGESLSDIIVNIGDMIQYKSWNSFSPLSADAAEWAIENKKMFPVGNINLWTGEEEEEAEEKDFEIQIEGEEAPADDVQISSETVSYEQFSSDCANYPKQSDAENDFVITAEELEGIEYVPTAERMQTSRYGTAAKKKFSIKTVLIKGLLWAFIGAFLGFGISEVAEPLIGEKTAGKLVGYPHYGAYMALQEESAEIENELYQEYEDACEKEGKEPSADEFVYWVYNSGEKYTAELEKIQDLYTESENEFTLSLEKEFNFTVPDDYYDEAKVERVGREIESTHNSITRISTAFWSALIAMFIGLLLGVGEGIYYGSARQAVKYGLIGAGISLGIGALSGYIAQWMHASMWNEESSKVMMALVRAIGWSIMGLGIGAAIGLIKPNWKRILFCGLGGMSGAFVGGFLFNYVGDWIPNVMVARGVAIVIMGLLIGICVGSMEQVAKSAWLKVIRGEFEGKEYLVFTGVTSIGNNGSNTIVLFKDKLVAPNHCEIIQTGSQYVLVDKGSPLGTVVNGMPITRHTLRQGDAIAIGNSVLVFNTK